VVSLIHDTTIITADGDETVHFNAAMAIDGQRIIAVGPSDALTARYANGERIDGTGMLVMPGFANCHTHLTATIARGIFEDYPTYAHPPFDDVNRPAIPDWTSAEQGLMGRLGALEAIRSGTTLAMEDSIGNAERMEGLVACGLRLVVAERVADRANGTVGAQGPFERDPSMAAEGLDRIERLHQRWHGAEDGRISVAVSAWAPDLCSPELLRDLRALQDRLDTVATCHLNQVWGEVAAVKANRGMLPTEYLASTGFLSERLVAAHCRCMTPAEEEIAGKAGIAVAFNSCMAARRGLSPNIADLESHGCTIALGTDNMAEDMVEVMRTAMFMERVRRKDGAHPTPDQTLGWATANGYRALGVADGGVLAEGRLADLIMIDSRRAHLVPMVRPVSAFVHNGQAADVQAVMVGGEWIMRDGKVLTMDEDALLAKAQATSVALWRRMYTANPEAHRPNGFDPATAGAA